MWFERKVACLVADFSKTIFPKGGECFSPPLVVYVAIMDIFSIIFNFVSDFFLSIYKFVLKKNYQYQQRIIFSFFQNFVSDFFFNFINFFTRKISINSELYSVCCLISNWLIGANFAFFFTKSSLSSFRASSRRLWLSRLIQSTNLSWLSSWKTWKPFMSSQRTPR